jgi:hypothetical protein
VNRSSWLRSKAAFAAFVVGLNSIVMDSKVHFIFKCRKCDRTTGQCRCPNFSGKKPIKYVESCAVCANEKKEK